MQESYNQHQAAQFRVALLLKQYKFGAAAAAKYLGKSRGLVQSWMQIGNKHHLAKEKIKIKSFEKIVKNLRRKITHENLDYFLVMKLLKLDLPVAFISRVMDLPTSTVRSWRYGKVPSEIKKFFYDPKIVKREFNKLLRQLKIEITKNNLDYFLAVRLVETARKELGNRKVGGRIISQILTKHFGNIESIPEKTVSCWIDSKRRPWDAFPILMDENRVNQEYNKIIDELTYLHLNYHISKKLADEYNWKYSKISKDLGLNKELVRGWIKKGRGNPVAKTFVNHDIINEEIKKYVNPENPKNNMRLKDNNIKSDKFQEKLSIYNSQKRTTRKIDNMLSDEELDLEQELIYHLETFPNGVTSPKILKSILIDYNDVPIETIERVMKLSKKIVKNRLTGKWVLKDFEDDGLEERTIDKELKMINCERKDEDVVCQD
jgi:hypothetical protein